jgi:hypothetical protein
MFMISQFVEREFGNWKERSGGGLRGKRRRRKGIEQRGDV